MRAPAARRVVTIESPDDAFDTRLTTATRAMLAAVLAIAFWLRSAQPGFNTAFEDESFMILMGRSILARAPDVDVYMRTAFGWFLWPVSAALVDRGWGLVGVRVLAGALGTAATLGMFALGRRLFGTAVGLLAAALFAVATPTILTGKLATHDAASVPLLVLSLYLFVRGAQTRATGAWVAAAIACFATFTVKHPLAAVFPALCVTALFVGRARGFVFAATLSALVLAYAVAYWDVLLALLAFVQGFDAFRAPADALPRLYFTERLDLWAVVLLAVVGAARGDRRTRWIALAAFAAAASFAATHVSRRLDYHTWKHAAYPIVLLLPVAAAGAMRGMRGLVRGDGSLVAPLSVILAFTVHLFGRQGLLPDAGGLPFRWPNTHHVADFLAPRLLPGQRALLDDNALRYALADGLPQASMTDLYWFEYAGQQGAPAYAAAVRDGYFDYVVFDGNAAPAAAALRRVVDPALADRYVLRHQSDQPATGQLAAVYERISPAVSRPAGSARIVDLSPARGAHVLASGDPPTAPVTGRVENAATGMRLTLDVFTNQWYPQADARLEADGRFAGTVVLGGQGAQRCRHVLRVRVLDPKGRILDEATVAGVARATPDSATLDCPER